MNNEIWKDIPELIGYQCSNIGRIRSLDRVVIYSDGRHYNYKGKILTESLDFGGYSNKCINNKNIKLHRLVAQLFIPNPENKPQINHINGIRNDNRVENLEWCTCSENMFHSYSILNRKSINKGKLGGKMCTSKHIFQYSLDNIFIKEWDCITTAANVLKIDNSSIGKCARNIKKQVGGYIWKYNN